MSDSEDNNLVLDYVLIPLKNNDKEVIAYAKIDKDDYDEVNKYVWRKLDRYCKAKINEDDLFMHQLLMGRAPKGHVIDHFDGDGLNNTRANPRISFFKR
jgi:hypothetical protein